MFSGTDWGPACAADSSNDVAALVSSQLPGDDPHATPTASLSIAGDGATQAAALPTATDIAIATPNQAPWLYNPMSATAAPGVPLIFSWASFTAIATFDDGAGQEQVSLSVDHGSIHLSDAPGVTITAGANDSGNVTIVGALGDINIALGNLAYTSNPGFIGNDLLAIDVNDLQATSPGGALETSDTIPITVIPVNTAPVNTLPAGPFVTGSAVPLYLPGISVADAEAGNANIQVTLGCTQGGLTVATDVPGGVTAAQISDNGLFPVLTASQQQINATLADPHGVSYRSYPSIVGQQHIIVETDDLAAGAFGDRLTATSTFQVEVQHVNQPPVITIPPVLPITGTSYPLAIGGFSVTDPDAGASNLTLTLTAGSGTLTVSGAIVGGLSAAQINGSGTSSVTLVGTQQAIDATLAASGGLIYTSSAGFTGQDSISLAANDGGATGFGGPQSAQSLFKVSVNPVNQAPAFTPGADQTVLENSVAATVANWATNISAGAPSESAQTLNFITSNDNNNLFATQPSISPTGALSFKPATGASGTATVTVMLHDSGGTAFGGDDTSASITFTIIVTPTSSPGFGNLSPSYPPQPDVIPDPTVAGPGPVPVPQAGLSIAAPADCVLMTSPIIITTPGVYNITQNLHFTGDAFVVAAANVTINFNGHTVYYGDGEVDGQRGIYSWVSWAGPTWNKDYNPAGGVTNTDLTVTGGALIHNGIGNQCQGISGNTIDHLNVQNMYILSSGKDTSTINYRYGALTVENNVLVARQTDTVDRMGLPANVFNLNGTLIADRNVVVGGNSGLYGGDNSQITDNYIAQDEFATNGYGAGVGVNGLIGGNIIFPRVAGRGFQLSSNGEVASNNVVVVRELPNAEFGWALQSPGIRSRDYGPGQQGMAENATATGNTILVMGGGYDASAAGMYISDIVGHNTFTNNTVMSLLIGDDSHGQQANAVALEGLGRDTTKTAQDFITGNTFLSNQHLFALTGFDGSANMQQPLAGNSVGWIDGTTAENIVNQAIQTQLAAMGMTNQPTVQNLLAQSWANLAMLDSVGLQPDYSTFVSGFYGVTDELATLVDTTPSPLSIAPVGFGVGDITAGLQQQNRKIAIGHSVAVTFLHNGLPAANQTITVQSDGGESYQVQIVNGVGLIPWLDYVLVNQPPGSQTYVKQTRSTMSVNVNGVLIPIAQGVAVTLP